MNERKRYAERWQPNGGSNYQQTPLINRGRVLAFSPPLSPNPLSPSLSHSRAALSIHPSLRVYIHTAARARARFFFFPSISLPHCAEVQRSTGGVFYFNYYPASVSGRRRAERYPRFLELRSSVCVRGEFL